MLLVLGGVSVNRYPLDSIDRELVRLTNSYVKSTSPERCLLS
jgi:hypothetical protein